MKNKEGGTMENMKLYEMARTVPQEAIKPIQAGRLKGMSDINPMYRIKRLTEMFGPCGVGWWYDVTRKEIVYDEITAQKCAFVDINLYYVDPETGHDSHAIPGTGGASFVATERNGPYMSDECYKMALTDAISVAAKALGIGADIYYQKDRTKYTANTVQPEPLPDDALKPGEHVELPPAGSWNPRNALSLWCKRMGIKVQDFANMRTALINAKIVPDIKSGNLTPVDLDNLCNAMMENYGDMFKGLAS
jgi:hypothetical protein